MRVLFLLVAVAFSVPVWAAKSAKEVSDHRRDCYFKGDGHYDRYGVSCSPPAKVVKKKEKPAPKLDDLKSKPKNRVKAP